MTYQDVLEKARTSSGPHCRACPVCDGRACRSTMPGPGATAPWPPGKRRGPAPGSIRAQGLVHQNFFFFMIHRHRLTMRTLTAMTAG